MTIGLRTIKRTLLVAHSACIGISAEIDSLPGGTLDTSRSARAMQLDLSNVIASMFTLLGIHGIRTWNTFWNLERFSWKRQVAHNCHRVTPAGMVRQKEGAMSASHAASLGMLTPAAGVAAMQGLLLDLAAARSPRAAGSRQCTRAAETPLSS